MSDDWRTRWRETGRTFSGGQGSSYLVVNLNDEDDFAFVKTLKRQTDDRARRRFRREVAAYETLAAVRDSIPRLLHHNASQWGDRKVPLFMVLEYIEGVTLSDYIKANGAQSCAIAISSLGPLAKVISECHSDGIVHRDIKPRNVVLRDSDPAKPVLVDFGLSFNHANEDVDLTRVGEEVGNRFLRLPEHSTGGRSPLADITQAAGLAFYIMTATEPRILIDSAGRMPHQRPGMRDKLRAATEGERQLVSLESWFDRAFTVKVEHRFQAIISLHDALEAVMTRPAEPSESFEDLVAQVDDIANHVSTLAAREHVGRIQQTIARAAHVLRSFAGERGLEVIQSGHGVFGDTDEPHGKSLFSLESGTSHSEAPTQFQSYEIRVVGTDLILSIADEIRWRGPDPDDFFDRAVLTAALRHYLAKGNNPIG